MSVADRLRAMRRRGLGSGEGGAAGAESAGPGSVLLELEGRRYAAGLMWLVPRDARRRRGWTLRQARELGATWYAEREQQTGFWLGAEPEVAEGAVRSLAHDVVESIDTGGQGSWQALVECGGGRYAIVRGNGREILPSGDLVLEGRDEALGEFAAKGEWSAVYATPGLVPDARVVKVAAVEKSVVLVPVPFGRAAVRRRLGVAVVAAVVLGALVFVGQKAWELYQELTRVVEVQTRVVKVQETIKEGVDPGLFLERCEAVLAAAPAMPPVWERATLECKTDTSQVLEVQGRLEDGVLFTRWRLKPGANAALARTVVEERMGRWDVGAVLIAKGWAAMGVVVPMRTWEGEQPTLLEFRRSVDEAFGTIGKVSYRQEDGGYSVRVRTAYPPAVVRERTQGIRWLEAKSFEQAKGGWEFVLGRVEPLVIEKEIIKEIES